MTQFLFCLSASLALLSPLSPCFAAPTKGVAPALPAEVRSTFPQGATSFLYERLSIGPIGSKRLVHVWGTVRPNRPESLNSYDRYYTSPFCVDIFEPILSQKRWSWRLVNSAVYSDENPPELLRTHWLHPKQKSGPVLEIISGNGAPGVSTRHTLLTWNKGLEESPPTPQLFWSGGSGGGLISQQFDGIDKGGTMQITSVDSFGGRVTSTQKFSWDGERFVRAGAAK